MLLAYSPPLPLVIDYSLDANDNIAAKDEEGVILALKQDNCLRRVRLRMFATNLRKFIEALDGECPILEYLVIQNAIEDTSTILTLPETLQAPRLRHLMLVGFALPIGSPLLTTTAGLVTLCLVMTHPSTYFHSNTLLEWLLFMPQVETLSISFLFHDHNHDVEGQPGQLSHTPITTPITLPNLLVFKFLGVRAYLEALVNRITAPRLEKLQTVFIKSDINQHTLSLPCLLQFMNTTYALGFGSAKLAFSEDSVDMEVDSDEEAE